MSNKKARKKDDKASPRQSTDEKREADYYARKVGLTKAEALKLIQDAKVAKSG